MFSYLSDFSASVSEETLTRLGETALLLLLYVTMRIGVNRGTPGIIRDPERRFRFTKYVKLMLNAVLVLCIYQLWAERGWSVASFIGLLSAGLAIVFREPLLNLAGWLFIMARRPFNLGDRVQVGTLYAGDVIDIGVHDFTLMEIGNWVDADQSTGRIVHVPNSVVFTQSVANYHEGFPLLWNELPVLLTYESDWRQAKRVLQRIAEDTCEINPETQERTRQELAKFKRYFISYTHLTPSVYLSKDPSGILLTVRYLCEPRRRRSSESQLWENIFEALLKRDDIQLAYPTRRLIHGPEGSPPPESGPTVSRAGPS